MQLVYIHFFTRKCFWSNEDSDNDGDGDDDGNDADIDGDADDNDGDADGGDGAASTFSDNDRGGFTESSDKASAPP